MSEHPPIGDRSESALYRSTIKGRLTASRVTTIGAAGAVGAIVFLAVRLHSEVGTKPYFEDEAVAGLIAARPLPEVIHTVLWERGGSPLHFVLAHFALSALPSVDALRWLSVVCALGAVACAYALGRELAGDLAGAAAEVGGAADAHEPRGRQVREPADRHIAGIRKSEGIVLVRREQRVVEFAIGVHGPSRSSPAKPPEHTPKK